MVYSRLRAVCFFDLLKGFTTSSVEMKNASLCCSLQMHFIAGLSEVLRDLKVKAKIYLFIYFLSLKLFCALRL